MDTNPTSSPLPPEVLGGRDGWRGEFVATLRLSWPLAAANLLQMLTYAVDVIFIARLGEAQLAASALAVACCLPGGSSSRTSRSTASPTPLAPGGSS